MHLRLLALPTLALPFVFVTCTNDGNDKSDVPVTQSMPNQGMSNGQPPGSNQQAGGINETPNTPSASGNGEAPNPVTQLQQPGNGATGGGAAGAPGTAAGPFTCVLPDLPDPQNLTYVNEKLPDPFTFLDGTKVTTREQWDCRRKEILAIAAKYLYAPVPPAPDSVSGTVNGGAIA